MMKNVLDLTEQFYDRLRRHFCRLVYDLDYCNSYPPHPDNYSAKQWWSYECDVNNFRPIIGLINGWEDDLCTNCMGTGHPIDFKRPDTFKKCLVCNGSGHVPIGNGAMTNKNALMMNYLISFDNDATYFRIDEAIPF